MILWSRWSVQSRGFESTWLWRSVQRERDGHLDLDVRRSFTREQYARSVTDTRCSFSDTLECSYRRKLRIQAYLGTRVVRYARGIDRLVLRGSYGRLDSCDVFRDSLGKVFKKLCFTEHLHCYRRCSASISVLFLSTACALPYDSSGSATPAVRMTVDNHQNVGAGGHSSLQPPPRKSRFHLPHHGKEDYSHVRSSMDTGRSKKPKKATAVAAAAVSALTSALPPVVPPPRSGMSRLIAGGTRRGHSPVLMPRSLDGKIRRTQSLSPAEREDAVADHAAARREAKAEFEKEAGRLQAALAKQQRTARQLRKDRDEGKHIAAVLETGKGGELVAWQQRMHDAAQQKLKDDMKASPRRRSEPSQPPSSPNGSVSSSRPSSASSSEAEEETDDVVGPVGGPLPLPRRLRRVSRHKRRIQRDINGERSLSVGDDSPPRFANPSRRAVSFDDPSTPRLAFPPIPLATPSLTDMSMITSGEVFVESSDLPMATLKISDSPSGLNTNIRPARLRV